MRLISFLLLSFVLFSAAFGQSYKQVKVFLQNQSDIAVLAKKGFAVEDGFFRKEDKSVTLFVSEDEFRTLATLGFKSEVLIEDWLQYYRSREQLSLSKRQAVLNESALKYGVTGMGFGSMGGYYTLEEVYQQLDSMRARFPGLITAKDSIGSSSEKRPIYMVKISDNPESDENEPEVLFTGLHHAREPQGMTCILYFMYYLLENYNSDPSVRFLVDNREMYFIPVVNTDGYYYNQFTNPQGGGMWRKNRSVNGSSIGVDLNRNYGPYKYWNADNDGSSTEPGWDTYRGAAPFSEPEVLAIKNFLLKRKIRVCLNYHTYSNLLIYPYGALPHETVDSLTFREFANDMTAMNGYSAGTDIQTVGYSTRGNSDDFMYDGDPAIGKIYAMTPEVGNGSDGFWPRQGRIFPLAQENLRPNIYYAMAAGEYVCLDNLSFDRQFFLAGDTVNISAEVRNKGLSTAFNVNVNISSLSSYVSVLKDGYSADSIRSRSSIKRDNSFRVYISPDAPVEHEVLLVVASGSGNTVMSVDTVSFTIGKPAYVFKDTTNNPALLWKLAADSGNAWSYTTADYYSAPGCFTDSKNGNYIDYNENTMELKNSVSLSGVASPRLVFWTKFELEPGYDYGQVLITTDNGASWIPLAGRYTKTGAGMFQPTGQPVYNGIKIRWVKEEINLSSYSGKNIKLKFIVKSDEYQGRDGWYLDDISIIRYIDGTSAILSDPTPGTDPGYVYALSQNFPNPFNPSTIIRFSLAREGMTELRIFNSLGEEEALLISQHMSAGPHSVQWNAEGFPAGMYFYRLKSGSFVKTGKMVLLK